MFSKQKGLLPLFTKFLSLILFVYYLVIVLNGTVGWLTEKFPLKNAVFVTLGLFIPFIFPGLFFGGLFPDILITKKGVYYKSTFIKGLILWEEIEDIIEIHNRRILNNYFALLISREGVSIINYKGLFFQYQYSRFLNCYLPILLISPGMDEVINMIKNHLESDNLK